MNDTTVENLKYFADARVGAEGLEEDTELTIYTHNDAWGEYSLIITRNDNKWNDSIEVLCGEVENWTI